MLSVPLLKQLLAAQQLCAGAAAVSSATQRLCLNPQRSTSALGIATQAAPSPDASSSASAEDSSAAAAGQQQQHLQQQSWLPSRALPASSVYGVKITIKAHDLIFVKMASTAIRDLVLVNFAPKSRDVLPELWRLDGSGVPWVNLVRERQAVLLTTLFITDTCFIVESPAQHSNGWGNVMVVTLSSVGQACSASYACTSVFARDCCATCVHGL